MIDPDINLTPDQRKLVMARHCEEPLGDEAIQCGWIAALLLVARDDEKPLSLLVCVYRRLKKLFRLT